MNRILRMRRQAGVGIITAIFLLVVLAGLGVAMVGIYTSQQSSANLDLMGAQAYQAARAGVEWGVFQRKRNQPCTAAMQIDMPQGSSLSGFTVFVRCRKQGDGALVRYLITSEACNLPDTVNKQCPQRNNAESVQRKLEVEL